MWTGVELGELVDPPPVPLVGCELLVGFPPPPDDRHSL
jgi:hypothetical protein